MRVICLRSPQTQIVHCTIFNSIKNSFHSDGCSLNFYVHPNTWPTWVKKKPAKNTPFKSPIHRYPMDEIVLSNCALPAPHLEWFSCSPPHSYNYAAIWWALVSVYRMATETRKVGVQDGHSTIMASADMASTPAKTVTLCMLALGPTPLTKTDAYVGING